MYGEEGRKEAEGREEGVTGNGRVRRVRMHNQIIKKNESKD